MYEKSITRVFLGAFFWAPIPFKRYHNTSVYNTSILNNLSGQAYPTLLMHTSCKLVMNCESEKMHPDTWLIKTTCLHKGHSFSRGQLNEYQLAKELWQKEPDSS